MDISFETTPGDSKTAITKSHPNSPPARIVADDDPRLVALRAAAAALIPAAGLGDTETVEMSLAMSDDPGWAVVRVGRFLREE